MFRRFLNDQKAAEKVAGGFHPLADHPQGDNALNDEKIAQIVLLRDPSLCSG